MKKIDTPSQLHVLNSNQNDKVKGLHEIQLKIITEEQQFLLLEEEWNDLTKRAETTVYQTFKWNKTWWKHFGDEKKMHIITIYEDSQLIGIAPFFIDTVSFGGITLYSGLRFIGSTVSQPEGEDLKGLLPYSDYLNVIVDQEREKEVYEMLVSYLKSDLPFDEVVLDEIPDDSKLLQALLTFLRDENKKYSVTKASVCPVIKLQDTWEEYLSSLSKSSRYRIRRYVKRANKKGYKVFEVETVNTTQKMEPFYDALVEMHQQRWNAEGYPGAFAENRFYDFLKEATHELIKEGYAELKVARALEENNAIIAADLIFKYDKRVYLVHRGFDIHAETNDYGPGNVLLYQGLKDAIEENYNVIDFLRGAENYKFRSANEVVQNRKLTMKLGMNPLGIGSFAKNLIRWKRRLRLEIDQMKITMRNYDSMYEGFKKYGIFVYERFKAKL